MSYEAVVFDVHGTLVGQYTHEMYLDTLADTARALGVDVGEFSDRWLGGGERTSLRMRGLVGFEDEVISVCRVLGSSPGPDQIAGDYEAYSDHSRRMFVPREDAIPTLFRLRELGFKIGIVSNCSWEAPGVWHSSALSTLADIAIFSCEVGLEKPDRRIFELACEQLGVDPSKCLFVGDMGLDEFSGALEIGMTAALLCVPEELEHVMRRPGCRAWDGMVIERLGEVLGVL